MALLRWVGACFYGGCLYHVITKYVIAVYRFEDKSMYPTINEMSHDDHMIVVMHSARHRDFKKGDIIVFRQPDQPNQLICKRISRLQGDKIPPTSTMPLSLSIVPLGHVWAEGDNLGVSHDSRHFGPVPMALIQSKVLFRVWPPSHVGWVT